MGSLCPSKVRVHGERMITPITLVIDQTQLETVWKQEEKNSQLIESKYPNDQLGFHFTQYLLKEIEQVPLQHYLKEFSEQRQQLQQQISKPVSELAKSDYSSPELNEVLKKYYCFITFVQSGNVQAVVAFWKEKIDLISVNQAIEYYTQKFFTFGGRLRREMAFRSITPDVKTPERFIKTREWIKKQQD